MTRGFVTIATGSENYYRIARNLLRSYRLFTASPMPFALICDKENEYTEEFDSVVVLENPFRSYVDKLFIPDFTPFDETIFIDSDCLAYRDLNAFWDAFENGPDFSAFGKNYPVTYNYAWFKKENVGEFADRIKSIPDFIGGVYFFRKTPCLKAFTETVWYIYDHYHDYTFRQFEDPCDEPIFALAMSVHGFTTAGDRSLPICFYPHCTVLKADLTSGSVRYDSIYRREEGLMDGAYMIHWGSGLTWQRVYRIEEYKLGRLIQGAEPGKIEVFLVKTRMWLRSQAGRCLRLAKRIVKRILGKG